MTFRGNTSKLPLGKMVTYYGTRSIDKKEISPETPIIWSSTAARIGDGEEVELGDLTLLIRLLLIY